MKLKYIINNGSHKFDRQSHYSPISPISVYSSKYIYPSSRFLRLNFKPRTSKINKHPNTNLLHSLVESFARWQIIVNNSRHV